LHSASPFRFASRPRSSSLGGTRFQRPPAEASADGTEAAAKPKRTTKKAAADKADDQAASDGTAEAANAPEAAPTEEVAT